MSGSPKCSQAQLRREQAERLRLERERQAEREKQQRIQEEQRRRKERLAATRGKAQTQCQNLAANIAALSARDQGAFAAAGIGALQKRLDLASSTTKTATQIEVLESTLQDLDRMQVDFTRLAAEAEAARFAAHLAQEEANLERLCHCRKAIDQKRSTKFDRAGLAAVDELLGKARAALAQKNLALTAKLTGEAETSMDRHRTNVQMQYDAWFQKYDAARRAIQGVEDRLSGLRIDEVVVRWEGPLVLQMENQARRLQALLETENYAEVEASAGKMLAEAEGVVGRAGEAQLRDDKRNYIVNGILKVMAQQGFVVQNGYPTHERPREPASPTLIYANRLGGGGIGISVPQDGQIWYDVEGFAFDESQSAEGGIIRSCDTAETQLLELHRVLDEAFGIEMSELTWEGKDPLRVNSNKKSLPLSTGAQPNQHRTVN